MPASAILNGVILHATPGSVPPEMTWPRVLTGWTLEPVPLLAVLVTAALYLGAVRRLKQRGDRWSVGRTLAFVVGGLGSVLIATQSFLGTYDTVLIWVHMVQHMMLSMIVPIFLALGAPITLLLRVSGSRTHRLVLRVLHSKVAAVLTFPVVAGLLFVLNPYVLYFTPLYQATLEHAWLHDLNHLHFVLIGCLWFWPLIGVDPMPRRMPYGFRMLAAFATMPFHAWLGVTIMSSSTLIAEDWYLNLGRTWGPSPLQDQRMAGGILWTAGELVSLLIFGALFVQWMRESEREARREDRRLDRIDAEVARAEQGLPVEGLPAEPQP